VRRIKINISIPYSFIFKRKEKKKIEEENYLTPLTQPSPRLGRGLKNTISWLLVFS